MFFKFIGIAISCFLFYCPFLYGQGSCGLAQWTLGNNKPVIESFDDPYGVFCSNCFIYAVPGTDPFYYVVSDSVQEGSIIFWIYDPGNCVEDPDPGYGDNGPMWGLRNSKGQAIGVGINRQNSQAGCCGYSICSNFSPQSPQWFKDGVRMADGVAWDPGWYKWTIEYQYNIITFKLYDVDYDSIPGDGCGLAHGDISVTVDSNFADGMFKSALDERWNSFYLKGDAATGIEDIYVYIESGTGMFDEAATACHIDILSTPLTNAYVDSLYVYELEVRSQYVYCNTTCLPSYSPIKYFILITAPEDMSVDSTGKISWIPHSNDVGDHSVSVCVENICAITDTQNYILSVSYPSAVKEKRRNIFYIKDPVVRCPNPCDDKMHCTFKGQGSIEVTIYDMKGRHLISLHGKKDIVWTFKDKSGSNLPGGLYCAVLTIGGEVFSKYILKLH